MNAVGQKSAPHTFGINSKSSSASFATLGARVRAEQPCSMPISSSRTVEALLGGDPLGRRESGSGSGGGRIGGDVAARWKGAIYLNGHGFITTGRRIIDQASQFIFCFM